MDVFSPKSFSPRQKLIEKYCLIVCLEQISWPLSLVQMLFDVCVSNGGTQPALIKAPVSSLETQHLMLSDCLMFAVRR